MAEIQLKAKILPRSDTEANWSSVNPSILPQELIYITDKNDFKINGTGAATSFSNLQYLFESKLLGLLTEEEANTKYLQLAGGNITGNLDVDGSLTVGTLSGLLKATNGVVAAAVAGTDYPNPQIYTDTGINFAPYYGSTQQNIIHFGAGYHQIYGYSVGMSGGVSVVRAGYNGNNCVELSANGTNWVIIGQGTLYPTSSTMILGQSSTPWQSVYANKYLSGSNTALTFGFANGNTAFSAGYSPEALVPGVIKNLGISDNAWSNLYIWESVYLNTSTSSTKGMSIKYNDDEEAIEFLAE